MVMADFSGSEAEELRRALSFHRSQERMEKVCVKLRAGMERKGIAARGDRADRHGGAIVRGLRLSRKSHAISFALLAYASAG